MTTADKPKLSQEILAGLTSATVILPKAMAYASVAGLTVAVGFYTALLPILVYAALGTSRVLSVTSTTTIAILTAVELERFAVSTDPANLMGINAALTILVGGILLLASLCRLGFLANFISTPVLIGFKAGIGLIIVVDQIPKLLGIYIKKENFFSDVASLFQKIPETSLNTLSVATASFVLYFGLKKLAPRSPVSLLVVAGGILASYLLQLQTRGVSIVGFIPQGLPPLTLPNLSVLQDLLPGALGIALMSFTESIAVGRTFQKPGEPRINANRELIATGTANILGGLLGAMPAGGGASQTAVIRAAGGTSQRTNLVVAAAALATLLLFAPVLGLMPNATLAAIVIIYSVGLIQLKEFVEVRKIRTMEFRWAVGACLGVLLFGTLPGIVIAIVMSLIGLASQTAHPRVAVLGRKKNTSVLRPLSSDHPDDELLEGLLIVRPEGRMYFLNAQNIGEQINSLIAKYKPEVLVLDMSRVPDLEYSALKMLIEGDERLTTQGGIQWITSLNPNVLKVVRQSVWHQALEGRMFFNNQLAIEHYQNSRTAVAASARRHGREQSGSTAFH